MIISTKNLLCVIAIVTFSLVLISQKNSRHPNAARTETKEVVTMVESPIRSSFSLGFPLRLKIPRIDVDAHLEEVSLTSDGALGVPKDPADAAWYKLGPRPGENGNSVIDGHFGWSNGVPAVFDSLYKLQKGDKIYILDKKGKTITFVVRELRNFGEHDDTKIVFASRDGKPHLNLISCKGDWSISKQSYSQRLVVFADLE
jgi:LPXTG-site transpeptidase (sortase) family protein